MFNSSILPSYSYIGTAFKSFFTCTHYSALLLTKRTELCLGTIVQLRCFISFFYCFLVVLFLCLFCSMQYRYSLCTTLSPEHNTSLCYPGCFNKSVLYYKLH